MNALSGTSHKVITIGASTGGTEALKVVLSKLPANSLAIMVVQHMPANFTTAFAERLNSLSQVTVKRVSGIIGMTGSARGSLALSFSANSILKIVSNMLGENYKEINGEVRDAVGEITNMISGVARKKTRISRF